MFTQLDLFGDLPSPEKPSEKPSRSEKRNSTRNAGSGITPTVQAQLTMGLPDQEFSEDARRLAENHAATERNDSSDLQAAAEKNREETVQASENSVPSPGDSMNLVTPPASVESDSEPDFSLPEMIGNQPEAGGVKSKGPSASPVMDKPLSQGKRYYIQTEIPADPPLEPRQILADNGMLAQTQVRQNFADSKPRYIQTEIPSDPPITESALPHQSDHTDAIDDPSHHPANNAATASTSSSAEEAGVGYSSESEPKPAPTVIPAESLRRTRPLMPPKVILTETTNETPLAAESLSEADDEQKAEELTNPSEKAEKDVDAKVMSLEASINEPAAEEVIVTEPATPVENVAVQENMTPPAADLPHSEPISAAPDVFAVADSAKKTSGSRSKKTIRETPAESTIPGIPPDDVLNSRQYYSIGEVAAMFSVKPSLLRYWESEFDILKLRKNRKGDRFFRPDDIRSLQLIHHLLREKKYTIDGAREYMRNARKMNEKFETIETLQRIRQFLVDMRNGLQTDKMEDIH
jgi:DNA-binding transcriptional MerR regulator